MIYKIDIKIRHNKHKYEALIAGCPRIESNVILPVQSLFVNVIQCCGYSPPS